MNDKAIDQVEAIRVDNESPTLSCLDLPEAAPGSPLCREWNFYRGQIGRLLADGHEGKFVLIKGEEIIGVWETRDEAKTVALEKYLLQPCLIHQIRGREPMVRMSQRFWACQS